MLVSSPHGSVQDGEEPVASECIPWVFQNVSLERLRWLETEMAGSVVYTGGRRRPAAKGASSGGSTEAGRAVMESRKGA